MTGQRKGWASERNIEPHQVCLQGGRRKPCYRSKQEAKRRARSGVVGMKLNVYRCPQCGFWHLTKQPQ